MTSLRRVSSSMGLLIKSKAPAFRAAMAASTLPGGNHRHRNVREIILDIFHQADAVAVGQAHIGEAQVGLHRATLAWASARVAAVNVRSPMRLRVISSSSRISGSSSTIKTRCLVILLPSIGALVQGNAKATFAAVGRPVIQVRIIDLTQFLAQVQAHAAACFHRGEKGLEQFGLVWRATPLPVSIMSIRHWWAVKSG